MRSPVDGKAAPRASMHHRFILSYLLVPNNVDVASKTSQESGPPPTTVAPSKFVLTRFHHPVQEQMDLLVGGMQRISQLASIAFWNEATSAGQSPYAYPHLPFPLHRPSALPHRSAERPQAHVLWRGSQTMPPIACHRRL